MFVFRWMVGTVVGLGVIGCAPVGPPEESESRGDVREVAPDPVPVGTREPETREPETLRGVVQLGAAGRASCALLSEGSVVCWGLFTDGRYEEPSVPLFGLPAMRPVRVEGPPATQLSVSSRAVRITGAGGAVFAAGRFEWAGLDHHTFEPLGTDAAHRLFQPHSRYAPVCWLRRDGAAECEGGQVRPIPAGLLFDRRAPNCFAQGTTVQCRVHAETVDAALHGPCTDDEDEPASYRIELDAHPVALHSFFRGACAVTSAGSVACVSAQARDIGCGPEGSHTSYAIRNSSFRGPFVDVSVPDGLAGKTYGLHPNGVVTRLDGGVPVAGAEDIVQLAASSLHTCGLRSDGRVSCWGANESGQLGNGSIVRDTDSDALEASLVLAPKVAINPVGTVLAKRARWGLRTSAEVDAPAPVLCPVSDED